MNGTKGATIAIVALLLTVMCGYLLNFEDTTETRTTYNEYANLDAIMYANSERGSGTEPYNSVYNVTGWYGNAIIPTTTAVNQYVITPEYVTYTETPATIAASDYITTLSTQVGVRIITGGWQTTADAVYYNGGTTYTNGEKLHGGYSVTLQYTPPFEQVIQNFNLTYYLNGAAIEYGSAVYFVDLADVITPANGIKVNVDSSYYYDYEITSAYAQVGGLPRNNNWSIQVNGTDYASADYMIYNGATLKWEIYNDADVKIGTASSALVVFDTATYTVLQEIPNNNTATYADPTKPVTLNYTGSYNIGAWSATRLNQDIIISKVSFIVSTDISRITYTDTSGYSIYSPGFSEQIKGTYAYALVTIDTVGKTLTIEGILGSDIDVLNYTLSGVKDTYAMNNDLKNIYTLDFSSFTHGSGYAYIVSTDIYTDPRGVLWNNFNVNLADYLPAEDVRVRFNGYVSIGDSLTINGQHFVIIDNKMTVPIFDGVATTYKQFDINGLCIDYKDGHTYLVLAGRTAPVDLGATTDRIISGTGAWYMGTYAFTIGEEQAVYKSWAPEWSMSMNMAILVFLGFIGMGCVIGYYMRGDNFGIIDWLALVFSAFIALSLMVV